MSLSEITSGLAAAMDETKAKLNSVGEQISKKKQELGYAQQRMPHTDDIVAAFKRGLDSAALSFESRLGWFLNHANVSMDDGPAIVQRSAPSLLMVQSKQPDPFIRSPFPWSALGENQRDIDVAAVTYFLRDQIEAELPKLVNKLCPYAAQGIKQADRVAEIRAIEAEIRTLEAESERLKDEINSAIKAVAPRN